MSKKDPFGTKRKCSSCDRFGTEENPVVYTENPYQAELNDDHCKDWYCSNCLEDYQGDI